MRLISLLVCVAACSSNPEGAVTGQPPGGTFDIVDMISATVTTSDGAGDSSSTARIVLASTSNLCSDATASPAVDRKGQHVITIELGDVAGAMRTAPIAAGSYTIYPNTGSEPAKSASLTLDALDDSCESIDDASASGQSGTVTLTTISAGVYSGSYDVTLDTGDHLAGTFNPTACPQLANVAANTDQHSCM